MPCRHPCVQPALRHTTQHNLLLKLGGKLYTALYKLGDKLSYNCNHTASTLAHGKYKLLNAPQVEPRAKKIGRVTCCTCDCSQGTWMWPTCKCLLLMCPAQQAGAVCAIRHTPSDWPQPAGEQTDNPATRSPLKQHAGCVQHMLLTAARLRLIAPCMALLASPTPQLDAGIKELRSEFTIPLGHKLFQPHLTTQTPTIFSQPVYECAPSPPTPTLARYNAMALACTSHSERIPPKHTGKPTSSDCL
jgi:hypothetical protein